MRKLNRKSPLPQIGCLRERQTLRITKSAFRQRMDVKVNIAGFQQLFFGTADISFSFDSAILRVYSDYRRNFFLPMLRCIISIYRK
jgi:hypothetical protein